MLSKAHASHAIRVCYLLFCVPCIFLCVCSASLRSLQLFLELLLVALARAIFEAFSACVDSLHYLFRISMDHKYSLGFLSTSEMSTVLATKESNHSNIHCHVQKNETHAPLPCRTVHVQKKRRMRRCYAGRRSMTDRQSPRRHH